MKRTPQGSKNKEPGDPLKSKVKEKGGEKKQENKITVTPSLLGVLGERDCACELMAGAVRAHTHQHLGLPRRHDPPRDPDINNDQP